MGMISKTHKGKHYEAVAERYLSGDGLSIITRNFHARGGEIDLIMRDGQTIVFVEVRYRQSQHYGHAAETVTKSKMNNIIRAANVWLKQQGLSSYTTDYRFDLIAIHNGGKEIDWIQNAITQG